MGDLTYRQLCALRRFEGYVDISLSDTITQSFPFHKGLGTNEIFVEDHANYLDLAPNSPSRAEWTRSKTRSVNRHMPYWCKEYLIAEKVPEGLITSRIHDSVADEVDKVRIECDRNLRLLLRDFIHRFEIETLHKISDTDVEQRKLSVEKYLRCYKRFSINRYGIVFPDLLKICLDPPLHCELTINVLKTFCTNLHRQMNLMRFIPNAQCLETLVRHAKDMRFNFWGLWLEGVGPRLVPSFARYFRALNENPGFVKVLLKYGFKYLTGPAHYRFSYYTLHTITFRDRLVIESINVFARAEPYQRTKMLLIIHIFKAFGGFGRAAYADDMFEVFKYLIRSLSAPYVTPKELYETMEAAVIPEFKPELRRVVFMYSQADVFENDIRFPVPRRLMHLSRVAVRKVLAENFMLPDGIQRLKISNDLKAYLELKC